MNKVKDKGMTQHMKLRHKFMTQKQSHDITKQSPYHNHSTIVHKHYQSVWIIVNFFVANAIMDTKINQA